MKKYSELKSPEVTHNSRIGKWYHGRFIDNPEKGKRDIYPLPNSNAEKSRKDKKAKNQVHTGKRNEDLE